MTQRVKRAERKRRQRAREESWDEAEFLRRLMTPTAHDIAIQKGLELIRKHVKVEEEKKEKGDGVR
jgi:hypothetical protein